jgi:fermentation-respiration switch protein FrsA (DUF1100 family)
LGARGPNRRICGISPINEARNTCGRGCASRRRREGANSPENWCNGFVTIAFDASDQRESTREPRQWENPYIRTEDISAVIDCLTTLPYVDSNRIGAMGICAGRGYTANAAINARRINAVGTVSAVNIGSMFRNGWDNNAKSADAKGSKASLA